MFKQWRAPLLAHVREERNEPEMIAQEGNVEGFGESKFKAVQSVFAAYDLKKKETK